MRNDDSLSLWLGFLESLKDKIYSMESGIPLQNLCRDGVATLKEDFEVSDLVIHRISGRMLFGRFKMPFREVSRTGCDKVAWKAEMVAEIDFGFDTASGDLSFIQDEIRSDE